MPPLPEWRAITSPVLAGSYFCVLAPRRWLSAALRDKPALAGVE